MNIYTQRFVKLSDLFAGLPTLEQEWKDYDHSNFTWGDRNRSMINKATFLKSVDLCSDDFEVSVHLNDERAKLRYRLESLSDDVMIDLEN